LHIGVIWCGLDDVTGTKEAVIFGVGEKTKTMADFMERGAGEVVIKSGDFAVKVCVPERVGVKSKNDINLAGGEIFPG